MVLRQQTDIIKGSRLMIFMEVLSELTPIGFATNHLFSKQLNTIEISSINDGSHNALLPQNYSWTMQTDNLYSINGYKLLHYAIKVSDRYINRCDYSCKEITKILDITSKELFKYYYNYNRWNTRYSRRWNLIVNTRIKHLFNIYENSRT